ncbi:MAG: YraN family protein [Ardenticatenaceae bacterium]
MTSRQGLGRLGEELARRHLETSGYVVLNINYRARLGEIDIVAEKDGVLVFVEVRTRRGSQFGTPEESLTPGKQTHLISAAHQYLQANRAEDRNWRIDVVAVELDSHGKLLRVEVIENAVEG